MLRENFCKHRRRVPTFQKVGVFNKHDGEGLHDRLLRRVRNLRRLSEDERVRSSQCRICVNMVGLGSVIRVETRENRKYNFGTIREASCQNAEILFLGIFFKLRGKKALWLEYQRALWVPQDCLLNPPEVKGQTEIHLKTPHLMQYI